jgi:hypothetical protein
MKPQFSSLAARLYSREMSVAPAFGLALITLALLHLHTIAGALAAPPSDLMQIAWQPGRDLLERGAVDPGYPYPLWTLALLFPLVLLPATIAGTVWLAINLIVLAGTVVGLCAVLGVRRSMPLVILVAVLVGAYEPVRLGLMAGQVVIISLATLVGLTWAVLHGRPRTSGALIGLSFFKPQVMLLPAAYLMGNAVWRRRWAVPLMCAVVLALLIEIAAPLATQPRQIFGGGIGEHLLLYLGRTSTLWGLSLTALSPSLVVPALACGALLIWTTLVWLRELRAPSGGRTLYLVSLATTVNLLVVPYSWSYNQALLVLPLGYAAQLAWRLGGWARLSWTAVLALAFVVPTIMHATLALQYRSDVYPVFGALIVLPILAALQYQVEHSAMTGEAGAAPERAAGVAKARADG